MAMFGELRETLRTLGKGSIESCFLFNQELKLNPDMTENSNLETLIYVTISVSRRLQIKTTSGLHMQALASGTVNFYVVYCLVFLSLLNKIVGSLFEF